MADTKPGRPTNSERLAKIHDEARREFTRAQESQRDERKQCVEDRRFATIPGAQWEGPLAEQFANKPKFEVNKVHLSLMRIVNEYRNNRISVNFVSKDGTDNLQLADACDSLYRADEQDSAAEEAYDNAFDEGTSGGFGAWRLRACYEDDEDDEDDRQRIRLEPVYDADTSVYFDNDAKRQDKADAKHCWVIYSQDRQAYVAEWGDDPASWPKDINTTYFDWCTPDVVYLAEYYRVEEKRETVVFFADPTGKEIKETSPDDERLAELEADLFTEVRRKTVKSRKVRKFLMSGSKILEDQGYIAGKCIPIVPYFGKRWFIENIERIAGHVRYAKDPQRLKNMQLSKLGEISALSSVEKPIFTPEQITGHQMMWADDSIKNYPYALINPIENPDGTTMPAGPLGYTKSAAIPEALAALLQLTEQDMADILGRQQEGDRMLSNISADAVEMIQQRLDMLAFIFISNFSKAMRRCGEIWLSMAKDLYREKGRKMKAIGEAGNVETLELMKPAIDEKTGDLVSQNDLGDANFDVAADVGPSFSSRRDALVSKLTAMMSATTDPQTLKVLQAMIFMNMEGEGLSDFREYYRKQLVSEGVLQPNDEERAAMEEAAQNAQPSPQDQYLMAEAGKSQAQAQESQAKTGLLVAQTEGEQADTIKTLAEADRISREPIVQKGSAQ